MGVTFSSTMLRSGLRGEMELEGGVTDSAVLIPTLVL